ncbi:MAG: hypothetical protein J5530_03365, partial [Clostridia bacterium]|nr:hypothetical protein [Clostridia bacterium]
AVVVAHLHPAVIVCAVGEYLGEQVDSFHNKNSLPFICLYCITHFMICQILSLTKGQNGYKIYTG